MLVMSSSLDRATTKYMVCGVQSIPVWMMIFNTYKCLFTKVSVTPVDIPVDFIRNNLSESLVDRFRMKESRDILNVHSSPYTSRGSRMVMEIHRGIELLRFEPTSPILPVPEVFHSKLISTRCAWTRKYSLDSKVHGANMGPTWVLSAPDGLHFGPMKLAIRAAIALKPATA